MSDADTGVSIFWEPSGVTYSLTYSNYIPSIQLLKLCCVLPCSNIAVGGIFLL